MKALYISIVNLLLSLAVIAQSPPQGVRVNDKASDFTAKDQNGRKIWLKNELKNGAVVLVFYRGQWCPYCNRQLKSLQDSLSFIKEKGATLIAVSPEKPDNISKTIEKTKATYSVLFDDSLKIMKSYDVAYRVDSTTIEKYKKFGIDFYDVNGNNGASLPVPTVYIINKEGIIIFKHFDQDYRKRVSVQEILLYL
jgi:peroxiredoxin